jgi:hypothetical protein
MRMGAGAAPSSCEPPLTRPSHGDRSFRSALGLSLPVNCARQRTRRVTNVTVVVVFAAHPKMAVADRVGRLGVRCTPSPLTRSGQRGITCVPRIVGQLPRESPHRRRHRWPASLGWWNVINPSARRSPVARRSHSSAQTRRAAVVLTSRPDHLHHRHSGAYSSSPTASKAGRRSRNWRSRSSFPFLMVRTWASEASTVTPLPRPRPR